MNVRSTSAILNRRFNHCYEGSQTQRFVRWWYASLLEFVPVKIQPMLRHQPVEFLLECKEYGLEIYHNSMDGPTLMDTLSWSGDSTAFRKQWQDMVNELDIEIVYAVLMLPSHLVLKGEFKLPAALMPNLNDVLRYEMDRLTPINVAELYFYYQVMHINNESQNKMLGIKLFLARRSVIDALLQPLQDRGLAVDALDIFNEDMACKLRCEINLLPIEKRLYRSRKQLGVSLIVVVVAVITISIAGHLSLEIKHNELRLARRLIQVEQQRAIEVEGLQKKVDEVANGANFLMEKRQGAPSTTEVLFHLTTALPEGTYLQRLSIKNGEVEFQGLSNAASSLIPLLEEYPSFSNVSLRASITRDKKTASEKFTLRADVNLLEMRKLGKDHYTASIPVTQ